MILRYALVLGLLIAAPAGSVAVAAGCMDTAKTQAEMTGCAAQSARESEAMLQERFARGQEIAEARDHGAAVLLRRAQAAWARYRDLACSAEVAMYEGGSMQTLVEERCMDRLTRARDADLRRIYEQN